MSHNLEDSNLINLLVVIDKVKDVDILNFFGEKGMDQSSVVRAALRQYYEWYGLKAASGEVMEDVVELE